MKLNDIEFARLKRECRELGVKSRPTDSGTSIEDVKLARAQRALRRLIPIVDSADEQLGEDFSALLDVYVCYVPRGISTKVKEELTRLKASWARASFAHAPTVKNLPESLRSGCRTNTQQPPSVPGAKKPRHWPGS